MSDFIVSARKYRPATFRSVVGQKHITSTLQNAIERGQLAHAYLFCGPRGVGKTTCARIFAKAINCLAPDGAEACNECESCRSFNEGRSLNIHELDAASNNSVEDIRTLIEQVRIIPQVGRYSVFIIDEVHMLSAAAFNAFLKTLEEPPAHAIFILATTEKHKIIPTILSRCQIYDFNRIKVEDSVEYLKYIAGQEGVGYDEESLNLIAQKADGGMRDALSMFDKAVSFCGARLEYKSVAQTLNVLDYDTYFNVTDMLLGGDYLSALRLFDEVLAKGFSGQTFMAGLAQHMRDLLGKLKNVTILDQQLTIRSAMAESQSAQLGALADALCATLPQPQVHASEPGTVDNQAMFALSYGLFVLSAREGERDNACIINTAAQVTDTPKRISITVNKQNLTHDMILKTGVFNLSVLSQDASFAQFQQYGFRSGRDTADKFDGAEPVRTANGLRYEPAGTNAVLSGKVIQTLDCGTHTLFLAEVTEARVLSDVPSATYAYYFEHIKPKPQPAAEKKTGFVCKICGYVYEGETLPADYICPLCKHGAEDFEPLK